MPHSNDGPVSPYFWFVRLPGELRFEDLSSALGISECMAQAAAHAPRGELAAWGIPFQADHPILINEDAVSVLVDPPLNAGWLIFLHTSDGIQREDMKMSVEDAGRGGFRGEGRLNEHAANYVIIYEDGSEECIPVRRRFQVGMYQRHWGENCFEAVAAHKPIPLRAAHEQLHKGWGYTQTRADMVDFAEWTNWLFAWRNPTPEKSIIGIRFEPVIGALVVSAISAGSAVDSQEHRLDETPLRWQPRRKALLRLPGDIQFRPDLNEDGFLGQIRLDMGQVISALPRTVYPAEGWAESYNNQLPQVATNEILIEYTAHPAACFHLWDGQVIPVSEVEEDNAVPGLLERVAPAVRRVNLRVVEKGSHRPVAVKLHVHGEAGEYLAPVDRHRIANPAWFEDYSVDFAHRWTHQCAYIPGETRIDLPLGKVYVEVAKGFEIRPLRAVLELSADTEEVVIELDRVLPWRERGWVTADTHVHFLSPGSALLEGAGEGVNVVNLLASQWGELMTNVGDFDGKTTWGALDTGGGPQGDGEYLVRVGTENRQHVLGHISLLGYGGRIIAPMTTGGPDESALGDPIEILLTEWARQCRRQGGIVVLPHFPNPRAEHAASIVSGDIDAVEMTSWGNLYGGIDPYSLADWYRYLNCGYRVPAVGGTDKMSADTAVGTVRTYARLPVDKLFTYQAWMEAVQRGETFVTYGPLLEFSVGGKPMGARIALTGSGGALDVTWQVASVTVPVTRVELVVNGVVRESQPVRAEGGSGSWTVRVEQSSWLALLVRGRYPDQPEIVAAHSSPVMVDVEGTQLLAAADAAVILDQIEGALVYLDTTGTRAGDAVYKRMRLVLESAYREVHNRMHQKGYFHGHNPATEHH